MEVSSHLCPPAPAMMSILCCMCGTSIAPNPSNTCPSCLATKADVTRGISTEVQLHQCRGCQRWHKDAGRWVACELESRELMALCLGNVSGLENKSQEETTRLTDASWIWTEPHSMRLKVRLTVQKEVQLGTILQQSFVVVFVVRNQQCVECQAEFRQGSWKSLVQVRQRVRHKRTFLYLEQLILKHGAHRGCLSIETFRDGMDFYFPDKSKAARFISFVENVVPIKVKASKKLIGTDDKSNVSNYKYTNLIEICALCKDDLVFLPKKIANSMGNIARCVLVKNVSNVIHFVDPLTGQTASMNSEVYWRDPILYRPIVTAARSRFTRFVILDKEAVHRDTFNNSKNNASHKRTSRRNRDRLARITYARESDLGINDARHEYNSYVGYLMKAGDVCVGYDLTEVQLVDDEAESVRGTDMLPNQIVLRKLYGGAAVEVINSDATIEAIAAKKRPFRLQRLDVDVTETADSDKKARKEMELDNIDEEDFLRELDADREMRGQVNLYKAEHVAKKKDDDDAMENNTEEDDDDDQQIKLDELLDGLVLDEVVKGKDVPKQQEIDKDAPWVLKNDMDDGVRAAEVGIKYVGKDVARDMKDKDAATSVPTFGAEFMGKKTNFL